MGGDINSPDWESQPSMSADGLKLFFASNRSGGMGGTDIWMCERLTGGEWSEPVNLGSDVNTADDEMSPCIAQDNRSLYFASNGHPGIGGYDIYVTRGSGKSWTKPENLGTPVNSEYDDQFFDPMVGTNNAFMVSDRPGGDGRLDVYAVVPNPLPPDAVTMVIGTVNDAKTRVPVGATLTVRDIESGDEISSFHSDDVNGNYVVVLQRGKTYVITAEAPGYLFYSDRFEVPDNSNNRTLRKDIALSSETVRLLLYFDFDKSTLKRESTVDLKRAIKWMRDNPALTIELAGHTDNKGTAEYNKKLSQDRANAVLEFLASKGVDRSRMTAKGYGFDEPVASNDNDEGRALNRRVEFRIKK
jgi:outer membrane protein OmpA-like peptidoglycan-associated protein